MHAPRPSPGPAPARRRSRAALLAALLAALAPGGALAAEPLGGRWKVVEAARGGKPNPAELGAVLSFADGTLTVTAPEGDEVEFEYTLDESHDPAWIDLARGADDKRVTLSGIWKIEADRFTLCVAPPFEERPTAFATAPGEPTSLTVHERLTDAKETR